MSADADDRSDDQRSIPAALRDATLASVVLLAAVGGGIARGATLTAPWVLAGAVLTVALEVIAGRERRRVRRAWERTATKGGALALATLAVAGGLAIAPGAAASLAVGACGSYLLLLALVELGIVPPSGEWT